MPIHLRAPAPYTGGPDGGGWNRLSITGGSQMWGDQCALRPRGYNDLRESRDTRLARHGGFGPCTHDGPCTECPLFAALTQPTHLNRPGEDRVLVRILDDLPHVMVNPDTGWDGWSYPWTWRGIARLEGWDIGRAMSDEHGEGFWLIRTGTGDAQ